MVSNINPEQLLEDLDPQQLVAVQAVSGPVAIHAGAGSGKTRVISRRTAYAIATDVVPADQVLIVTFTEKAAGEIVARLRGLGLPGVTARTFHAHALSQIRHFWPSRHDGDPLPELLDSKAPLVAPLARRLPGRYTFTPSKDLADEIEWAKTRRIAPRDYEEAAEREGRELPIPGDLVARVYDGYERQKNRAGRMDFEDLLLRTVDLLAEDEDAANIVRARKRWFSVDEYQDTNPLQQELLELWLGESRDLCVVGDEDQTIYSFTGASPAFLLDFGRRWPGATVLPLLRNYRSTPQILALANRLVVSAGIRHEPKEMIATQGDGPRPAILRLPTPEQELETVVAWVEGRLREGVQPGEIAILTRTNAALAPIEEALRDAKVSYQLRGQGFWGRPEVRGAIAALRRSPRPAGRGIGLGVEVRRRLGDTLGWAEDAAPEGQEAQERQAALDQVVRIVDEVIVRDPDGGLDDVLVELDARAAHERESSAGGVNLVTYHRAKGLEWDAVCLPGLDEGTLPIRQAKDDPAAIDEERRLFYVGITRARRFLAITSAGKRPSRFLRAIEPPPPPRGSRHPAGAGVGTGAGPGTAGGPPGGVPVVDGPLFEALRSWRTLRAREQAVPPYVVADDKTLRAIADARPRTLLALEEVKGIGPAKLDRYGAQILAVIEAHLARG